MQCSVIQGLLLNIVILYSATKHVTMVIYSFLPSTSPPPTATQAWALSFIFLTALLTMCWSRQPHVQHDGGARQAFVALGDKSLPRKGHKLRHLIFNWGHLKVTMKPEVSRGKVRTVCWPVLHSPLTPASHKPVTKNALQEVQGGVRRVQRSSILESTGSTVIFY